MNPIYDIDIRHKMRKGCVLMTADQSETSVSPRRGRPRTRRRLTTEGPLRCYGPQCHVTEEQEVVEILPEELEVLKLVDLLGYEQEEAAILLGVSRRTAWRDLHEARRKVADALVHGKGIEISGCLLRNKGHCPKMREEICPKTEGGACPRQWKKESGSQ